MKFNKDVVIRVMLVVLSMSLCLFSIEKYIHSPLVGIILSLFIAVFCSVFIGLKKQELIYAYSKILKKI